MQILSADIFRQNLPVIRSLLTELVEIESPSTEKRAVDRLGMHISRELEDLGGVILTVPQECAGDHIVCRWGSGPGGILLLAHMDTVYGLGALDSRPVFEAEGKLFGPGMLDMKGSIAMLLSVIRTFQQYQVWPGRPVTALFTSDEETGSLTSRALIEQEARQAAVVFCLEPALANGAIKTARKGTGLIDLRVKGVTAHAGVNHAQGRNAIEELAHHILSAQQQTDYGHGTTVNVGIVSGGTRTNVVPGEAQAQVDFRVATLDGYDRLEAWVKTLRPVVAGTELAAAIHLNRPPMPRDETMLCTFEKARQIGRAVGLELTEGSTGGGSDANFVAPLGIPVLDGLGPVGDGAHSEREYVLIESLAERAALLSALLLNW